MAGLGKARERRPETTVTVEFLQRTRVLSVTATVLLSMWLFGNLYESIVWNPRLIADPRPGLLVGELAAGSPVYYYLPLTPVGVVLAVVLRVRFGAVAPSPVRRSWNAALVLLFVALAVKLVLITQVNPVFRDPAESAQTVREYALWWAGGNGVAVLTVAAALVLLTWWRRPATADPAQEGGSGPT